MAKTAKNMDFRKLHALRGKMAIGEDFPIDWQEFNRLYSTSAPVVVRCPSGRWGKVERLLAFYAAIRVVREGRRVGILSNDPLNILDDAVKALSPRDAHKLLLDKVVNGMMPGGGFGRRIPMDADDWVFAMNWGYMDEVVPDDARLVPTMCCRAMDTLNASDGFRTWDNIIHLCHFYGDTPRPRKKVVLAWNSEDNTFFPSVREQYKNRFVFIDYTREKQLVDSWFSAGNETMLDPMFDIAIAESGLDLRKVFMYAATNYRRGFREYANAFPDVVGQYIGEKAFKAFM